MHEIYEFLQACPNYFLATINGSQPEIRPFASLACFEDRLYFFTDCRKDVSKQLTAHPHIQLCAMNQGQWLRLEAQAVLDRRSEALEHMLDTNPILKHAYSVNDGVSQVYYLKACSATVFDFTEIVKVVNF